MTNMQKNLTNIKNMCFENLSNSIPFSFSNTKQLSIDLVCHDFTKVCHSSSAKCFGKKVILFVTQIEFSEKVIQYIFGTNGIFWKSSFNIFVKEIPFSEMVIIFLGQIAFCFQPFANLTGHVMLHSKWRALGNLF